MLTVQVDVLIWVLPVWKEYFYNLPCLFFVYNLPTSTDQRCLAIFVTNSLTVTGDEPFKNVSVGLNLEKFIEHLQTGHRLAQPAGLSDKMYVVRLHTYIYIYIIYNIYIVLVIIAMYFDSYQKLLQCWSKSVEDRPSAADLKHFF